MKMVVIGHPEAVLGFSLVGVDGHAATTAAEAEQALDAALATEDIAIILITQDAAGWIGARMDRLKMSRTPPLIIEVPSPKGVAPGEPSLKDVVQRAIGIKI
jgi:V/A-type H+/Na+-transporting ATPase subunit F